MASAAGFVQKLASMRDASSVGWQQLAEAFLSMAEEADAYVPAGVEYRTLTVLQIPVETFTPPSSQGAVLLLHGGNYLLPLVDAYRAYAQQLALASGRTVVLVDYCIRPYHLADAMAEVRTVWQWLYAQDDRLCLAGDGSGANLALLLTQSLLAEGSGLPRGLVLLSPQTDMTCSGNSYYDNYYLDVFYGRRHLSGLDIPDAFMASPMWGYLEGLDLASPDVSPLFGAMRGLPPCHVVVGSHEVVLDDAKRFAARAEKEGVLVSLTVGEGLFYAYPMFGRQFDEARRAFEAVSAFLRSH